MARFDLKDQDYSFNASLDPYQVLKKMGFTENSMFQEGEIIRVHCPIHKDLVRKSLIIDRSEKTFKCQYANCDAHDGGLLVELVALYYDVEVSEVAKALFGEEDKASDLLFRGEMFINQGRHNEALPYLEQAVDLDPRNEITRCKLSALYLELGRKDDAFREYLKAAESYAVRGELDKTLSIYNILIMLQPGAVKARKELAFLFSRMGRPDAAAEQMKWVVDFYIKYNQQKGAQEACEQIIELDPSNPHVYLLYAKLLVHQGRKPQALQNYEASGRAFLKIGEIHQGIEVIEEALQLAPSNSRLKELMASLQEEKARMPQPVVEHGKAPKAIGDDMDLVDWFNQMESNLGVEREPSPSMGPPGSADMNLFPELKNDPVFQKVAATTGTNPNDTTEIAPDDRRVALCLNDMKELDSRQLEMMRQQLIGMFTDVRKSFEDGHLADWEMRTIKDFYKSFCVAVEMHRRRKQAI